MPPTTTRLRSGSMSGGQPTSDLRWAVPGPSEAAQRRPATTTSDSRARHSRRSPVLDLRDWPLRVNLRLAAARDGARSGTGPPDAAPQSPTQCA